MTVCEIVSEYLKANGYDGLYNEDCECKVDDLCPCGTEGVWNCKAGYVNKCDPETCPADGECEWHIGPKERE